MFSPDGFELSLFVIRSTFEGTRTRTRTRIFEGIFEGILSSKVLPEVISKVRKYESTSVLSKVPSRYNVVRVRVQRCTKVQRCTSGSVRVL